MVDLGNNADNRLSSAFNRPLGNLNYFFIIKLLLLLRLKNAFIYKAYADVSNIVKT